METLGRFTPVSNSNDIIVHARGARGLKKRNADTLMKVVE